MKETLQIAWAESLASFRAVKGRTWVLVAAALVLVVVGLEVVLPNVLHPSTTRSGHWETPAPVLLLGLIAGTTYGLLSVGLVLIYRTNRIINFAHGQIGAFGAAVFGVAATKWHIPYWIAFFPALLLAAGAGAASEAIVIRRLRKAPLVMSVVATLGIGQLLIILGVLINPQAGASATFPGPPGFPTFQVGALTVTPSYVSMLVLSPIAALAIGLFLRFSRVGVALRGAAANPEAARMAGIFASRMSSLAWGVAGALAAFSAILTAPTGYHPGDSFGPSLLLRAMVGAVLARMASMPLAVVWGIALGVLEQLLLWNYPNGGFVELGLFLLIVGALVLQRQRGGRTDEKGSWASVQALAPVPLALRQLWIIRNLPRLIAIVGVAFLLVLPKSGLIDNADAVVLTGDLGYVIVGLSAGIITGLAGQLSLGQFALSAIGAIVSYQVAYRTGSYLESFLYAGLAAAAASVLIGIPALRIRGLLLTVTTLGFALVVPAWLLAQPWAFGPGVDPGRPIVAGRALSSGSDYYYFGLAVAAVAFLLARNIRSGGLGRVLVAVRDNEDAARAFTVPAALVKLQGFGLAGFIAGIGGALYGHSLATVSPSSFPTAVSTQIIVMTVVGGLSILSGSILGVLFVFVLPQFAGLDSLGLLVTDFGLLVVIMYLPGGLATLLGGARDRLYKAIGRWAGIDVDAAYLAEASSGAAADEAPTRTPMPALAAPVRRRALAGPLLEVTGLTKSFGGVRAVRGTSFHVGAGETLGLIGPNGAGKTTTFELVAGFTKPDAGTVRLRGQDVTYLSPEARGRAGLIRSFQDAALFPTLTVLECVQLSLEKREPTRLLTAVSGWTGPERRKEKAARELVSWMGLDRYRSAQIQSLSTGTRRITEIACLVGLEPDLLLLDEPAAGVAQRETEALGLLLQQLKKDLDLTLVIIEHDIPMVMALSDRIVCMADGEVIAAGAPEIVRSDPRVVESYLGGDVTAIDRSGALAPAEAATSVPAPVPPRRRRRPAAPAGSTA